MGGNFLKIEKIKGVPYFKSPYLWN